MLPPGPSRRNSLSPRRTDSVANAASRGVSLSTAAGVPMVDTGEGRSDARAGFPALSDARSAARGRPEHDPALARAARDGAAAHRLEHAARAEPRRRSVHADQRLATGWSAHGRLPNGAALHQAFLSEALAPDLASV